MKNKSQETIRQQIQKSLKQYESRQITVKEYCELSSLILELEHHQEVLYSSYKQLHKASKKVQNGNYSLIAGLVCQPNVSYNQQKVLKKQKNVNSMIDAGKKIIGTICYAWDHYIRLIMSKKESTDTNQVQASYILSAKMRLSKMLKEMQDNKYHWEHFRKDLMTSKQYEEKQIREENIQIQMLNRLLQDEIFKMKKKTKQMPQPSNQNISQVKVKTKDKIDLSFIQTQKNRKSLTQLIAVGQYFINRKKSAKSNLAASDRISRYQKQRQSCTNVFRYFQTNQK